MFDAVAALVGSPVGSSLTDAQFYEGQAAIELDQQDVSTSPIAGRFHRSIAELLATVCFGAREQTGLNIVALSGGVFQNRLLLEQLTIRLEEMAFQVYINRLVPPNDGGVSLRQAAIAAARLQIGQENEYVSRYSRPDRSNGR